MSTESPTHEGLTDEERAAMYEGLADATKTGFEDWYREQARKARAVEGKDARHTP